jgi:uncharacterized short protein YbdD (DUF466 family)
MPTEAGRESGRPDGRVGEWISVLKRVCGMPDYSGYQAHMAERHPGGVVLSEREFFDQQLNARYGNGASRCC